MACHVWIQYGIQVVYITDPVCFAAQGSDLERKYGFLWEANADYKGDRRCAADV